MKDSILSFASQFLFEPNIERPFVSDGTLEPKHFIVGGMGGSHLAAGLVKAFRPGVELYVHRDYGLPPYDDRFMNDSLCIACSYSGNTEETLDFARMARAKGYRVAVITTGGALADWAASENIPTIMLPKDGIQPRMALGIATIALAKMIGDEQLISEMRDAVRDFNIASYKEKGDSLATKIYSSVPIIYASNRNLPLVYNWKIKFNETGKQPAFYNVFPELNHNEMTGFDVTENTKILSDRFRVVMLRDSEDDPRILKRMEVTAALYKERGIAVDIIDLEGSNRIARIFGSLILADWIALTLAERYGVEAEQVPMVEDFKTRIN